MCTMLNYKRTMNRTTLHYTTFSFLISTVACLYLWATPTMIVLTEDEISKQTHLWLGLVGNTALGFALYCIRTYIASYVHIVI